MIPVVPQLEPTDFEARVGRKGADYLKIVPNPNSKQFANHAYWTEVLPDLMQLYNENCAYSGLRLTKKAKEASVDHYLSKVENPNEAYKWNNFRLCNCRINGWKGINQVVDPFTIQPDWFYLDFNDLEVKVQPHIDLITKAKLEIDIEILRLNDRSFVDYRAEWYIRYNSGEATFTIVEKDAYFVAFELKRQGMIV